MKNMYAFLVTIAFSTTLHAQQPPEAIAHSRQAHFTVDVHAGGANEQILEIANVVSNPSELHTLGTAKIPYNSRLQVAEIIEAVTIKANGDKLPVDKGAILTQDVPGPNGITMLQDLKFKIIVFPQLEVGDSVYYKAQITQKAPEFPGQFSFAQVFPGNTLWDDAQVTVSAPKNYPLHVKAVGVAGGMPVDRGDTRTWTWTYKNMQARPIEPGMVSVPMYSPHVLVSSFADYRDIAAAYQAGAHDKTKVTPAIQSLADELTKGVTDQREKVKRLYDWVSHNVRYVANFLDIGGYIPHAADTVLANRYGDCKDHVVLLEALLAAKGIASTAVLIDLKPNYALPEVAIPQAFNHVITYVPSLDLYLDSTNPYAPFGVLPLEDTDKPVIHTAAYNGIERTPVNASDNASISKTAFAFDKDGALNGSIEISSRGPIGILMRGFAANIPPMRETEFLHQVFSHAGVPDAQGTLEKNDDANTGMHAFSIRYRGKNVLNVSAPGALTLDPPFTNPFSLNGALRSMAVRERKYPYLCTARSVEEDFEVTFPGNVKVMAIPKATNIEIADASYQSTYRLEGSKLIASRKFIARMNSNVCEPSHYGEHYKMTEAIVNDLKSQILYQIQ